MRAAFAASPAAPISPLLFQHPRLSRPASARPTALRRTRPSALLSVPFPLPDLFAFPGVAFPHATAASDLRPELLGSLLWTTGLYLGFSERERWGTALLTALTARLSRVLPPTAAEGVAIATHTLPYMAAGFGVDALLRHANGGNAIWALATGLSAALYGGVYELGRVSAGGKRVAPDEDGQYALFTDFARRRLAPRGMCHLVDIRAAVRSDPSARRLAVLSDETIRRFVRNRFPRAKRSPNGFYRGISIRAEGVGVRGDASNAASTSETQSR